VKPLPPETLRYLQSMSDDGKLRLYRQLQREVSEYRAKTQIWSYYPDDGPLRRELYVKHMEFFEASLVHNEVAFIGGNRTGKTHCVSYAATLHMLGRYPAWWTGRRFARPVTVWFAGEDAKAVRESLQEKLLGRPGSYGTGLVPGDSLVDVRPRAGVADTVDLFNVKHALGGKSRAVFKAYEQGRESFQSAAVDVVVLDEEPPLEIYTEALTRTLSTKPGQPNGLVMSSFTPLLGLSEVVLQFLPGGKIPETRELRMKAWSW
jgi:phage terminase large subunit-like protein